ncbi:hypothetical protein PCANC_00147 [Puccinia coronata f. sp. avenae]|uniref:Uncharacterized protein n=1 Tax=Puccinia coronata f. sp. avenae TaxID=200324 RepID=A0A2N5W8J3_9BASI|nr:hypothetical protein PCASD_14223 [Puccinia coronata f. sp. avenae]PLW58566.1 hypothetical protein PCANC_00147 [Puccinia coronata f. sp. avenae]
MPLFCGSDAFSARVLSGLLARLPTTPLLVLVPARSLTARGSTSPRPSGSSRACVYPTTRLHARLGP